MRALSLSPHIRKTDNEVSVENVSRLTPDRVISLTMHPSRKVGAPYKLGSLLGGRLSAPLLADRRLISKGVVSLGRARVFPRVLSLLPLYIVIPDVIMLYLP